MAILLHVTAPFIENDKGFIQVFGFNAPQGSQQGFDQNNFIISQGNHRHF
jgi:hypothetical protein